MLGRTAVVETPSRLSIDLLDGTVAIIESLIATSKQFDWRGIPCILNQIARQCSVSANDFLRDIADLQQLFEKL